jgi:hypothetical protein
MLGIAAEGLVAGGAFGAPGKGWGVGACAMSAAAFAHKRPAAIGYCVCSAEAMPCSFAMSVSVVRAAITACVVCESMPRSSLRPPGASDGEGAGGETMT